VWITLKLLYLPTAAAASAAAICLDHQLDVQTEARAAGILTEYHDARGQHRHVPVEVLERVIAALPTPGPDAAAPIVLRTDAEVANFSLGLGAEQRWGVSEGDRCMAQGCGPIRGLQLRIGVFRLDVDPSDSLRVSRTIVVAPAMAFQGEFDRVWVLAVQLYSLRSDSNWGIGDFSDLQRLIEVTLPLGCAGIGLNPLHALFDDEPANCSPYAPNSRLFLNPVYIDVVAIPEFAGADRELRESVDREKERELIDYEVVWRNKLRALRHAYENFAAHGTSRRSEAFEAFRRERGSLLMRYSCFETLRKQFRMPWWEWPQQYRQPDDAVIQEFRSGDLRADMEFVEYLQWNAHTQLQACTDLAAEGGMKVGLYLDVAVGVRADGFDAWLEQQAISRDLSVGAPPDLLNVAGQDWGLSGFNGSGLSARRFEPFRAMIAASARYAGAIRLDHVLGLGRLYLVPSGFSPKDGAYVQMPLDALLGVAALESRSSRCIIVGEDLGTVPDGFREKLSEWGIWSYKVMMFEREWDGAFKSPDQYPPQSLVTFNTHDLPPYAGWRDGHDLRVKREIGVDPGESDDERRQAIGALAAALSKGGLEGRDFPAVVEALGRAGSRILSVSLDDIVGVVEQINVPGTVDIHPNWRRRLDKPIASLDALARLGQVAVVLQRRKGA